MSIPREGDEIKDEKGRLTEEEWGILLSGEINDPSFREIAGRVRGFEDFMESVPDDPTEVGRLGQFRLMFLARLYSFIEYNEEKINDNIRQYEGERGFVVVEIPPPKARTFDLMFVTPEILEDLAEDWGEDDLRIVAGRRTLSRQIEEDISGVLVCFDDGYLARLAGSSMDAVVIF